MSGVESEAVAFEAHFSVSKLVPSYNVARGLWPKLVPKATHSPAHLAISGQIRQLPGPTRAVLVQHLKDVLRYKDLQVDDAEAVWGLKTELKHHITRISRTIDVIRKNDDLAQLIVLFRINHSEMSIIAIY
uniref:Uncharacterized protein n=1 Tax=Parascaris univalens TaxID=6257 RepID=A0A915CGS1_PARUN